MTEFFVYLAGHVVVAGAWYALGRLEGRRRAIARLAAYAQVGAVIRQQARRLDVGDSQTWTVTHTAPGQYELTNEDPR